MQLVEYPPSLNSYEQKFTSALSVNACYSRVLQLVSNGARASLGFLKVGDDYAHAVPEKDLVNIDVRVLAEQGISVRIITAYIAANNSELSITIDNIDQGPNGANTGVNIRAIVPQGHAISEYLNVSSIQELQRA